MTEGKNKKGRFTDRRWYDEPVYECPICNYCKHLHEYVVGSHIITCDAFPEGIPHEVTDVYPDEFDTGQECANGIKFDAKE